jgi:hypothetical protein
MKAPVKGAEPRDKKNIGVGDLPWHRRPLGLIFTNLPLLEIRFDDVWAAPDHRSLPALLR